jgi:hypothetical protein
MTIEPLLTREQAASLLAVSPNTLDYFRRTGKLTTVQTRRSRFDHSARRIFLKRAEVEALVSEMNARDEYRRNCRAEALRTLAG